MTEPIAIEVAVTLCRLWRPWRERMGLTDRSCIAATATALEVFRYFGIPAVAAPLSVQVQNPALVSYLVANDEPVLDSAKAIAAVGGHTIGVAASDERTAGGWDGHLAALLTDTNVLVDLSFDQFNRPERGIRLDPHVMPLPAEFWDGGWVMGIMNGCRVFYQHAPHATGFRQAPDWRKLPPAYRRGVGVLIRAIKRVGQHGELANGKGPDER